MKELWRPVVGFAGYEVSNLGRVRSLPRLGSDGRRWKGKVLRAFGTKYAMVGLSHGKVVSRTVHSLVLEAFRGPCPPGYEACHNDGNSKNNVLTNLRWDTRSANALDCTKHGRRTLRGERVAAAKLSASQVQKIKRLYLSGNHTHRSLGDAFGVHHSTIGGIMRGLAWRHVQ